MIVLILVSFCDLVGVHLQKIIGFIYLFIFQHKESVTMVRFGHNDPGLLACCSLDGTLSICQVADGEPRVLHTLRKHSAGVTG